MMQSMEKYTIGAHEIYSTSGIGLYGILSVFFPAGVVVMFIVIYLKNQDDHVPGCFDTPVDMWFDVSLSIASIICFIVIVTQLAKLVFDRRAKKRDFDI